MQVTETAEVRAGLSEALRVSPLLRASEPLRALNATAIGELLRALNTTATGGQFRAMSAAVISERFRAMNAAVISEHFRAMNATAIGELSSALNVTAIGDPFRVMNAITMPALNIGKLRRAAKKRTLDELIRYADALEGDSTEEFRDAGGSLWLSVETFEEAEGTGDGYAFTVVFRLAVGCMEEVARQIAGDGGIDLRKALTRLAQRGLISREDRGSLEELYRLRNTRPGLGHGAGRCPEYVAFFALSTVLRGLEALIPSSALPEYDEVPPHAVK